MVAQLYSPEETEFITAKYQEGWTASQIAGNLFGRTRNSVIGWLHRQGIVRSDAVNERNRAWRREQTKDRRTRARPSPRLREKTMGNHPHQPEPFVPPPDLVQEPLHIALTDLGPRDCRWPYGDANFTFCGHPKVDSSPYCEEHTRRAFNGR